MRVLVRPNAASSKVLTLCLDATTDVSLRARLQTVTSFLNASAISYDLHAVAETLNLIPRITSLGSVTKSELKNLYSEHMSAAKGAARPIYDQIKNAAPNKKCPLCGIGTVAVLDHHLPQSKYPDLAIVPNNLIPACHFCNDTKKARYPKSQGQQTLHPYFDARLINTRWIKASLDHASPPVVTFSASPPTNWLQIDRDRVERHFTVCGLAITFSSNANDELSLLRDRLIMLQQKGGATEVLAHLKEQALTYTSRPNCWQLSMYEALAADAWFVNGGFHSIA